MKKWAERFEQLEPECRYCLYCEEEYRPEIIHCATCGGELTSGKEVAEMVRAYRQQLLQRALPIVEGEETVTIRQGPSLQVRQLQAHLREYSLPSLVIAPPKGAGGKGCCGTELLLQVRRDDLDAVLAVVEEEYRKSTGLAEFDTTHADAVYDTGKEQATCPACGCTFPTQSTTCPDCGLCFT